jgi:hypothetical protein
VAAISPLKSGHEAGLVDWADPAGLAAATHLARTDVVTVAAAVGRHHIRECGAVTFIVDVDAIANAGPILHRVDQDPRCRQPGIPAVSAG